MSFWTSPPTCKLQGSLVALESFTIRLTDDPAGGAATSDMVISEGDTFDSVDDFLATWAATILADTGVAYTLEVNTSGGDKGKISIASGGNNMTIAWASAGDATESERWRDHLGATAATTTNTASPFTLPNAHKAGWYPSLAPSILERVSTGYRRGYGVSLATTSWTQADLARGDQGVTAIEVELQIDGRTDWSELFDLSTFFDDVFDSMGEPWTIINVPAGDTSGDYYTGYVADQPFEIMGERVEGAWNGLLAVSVRLDGAITPALDGGFSDDD